MDIKRNTKNGRLLSHIMLLADQTFDQPTNITWRFGGLIPTIKKSIFFKEKMFSTVLLFLVNIMVKEEKSLSWTGKKEDRYFKTLHHFSFPDCESGIYW